MGKIRLSYGMWCPIKCDLFFQYSSSLALSAGEATVLSTCSPCEHIPIWCLQQPVLLINMPAIPKRAFSSLPSGRASSLNLSFKSMATKDEEFPGRKWTVLWGFRWTQDFILYLKGLEALNRVGKWVQEGYRPRLRGFSADWALEGTPTWAAKATVEGGKAIRVKMWMCTLFD